MSKKNSMQSGQIDPAKLDAAAKPKRRRKERNRPPPAEELRDWEDAAEKRAFARPYPPGIMLEAAGMNAENWTAPHDDSSLWTLQLADVFGTRSQAVIATFLRQLEALCEQSHWDEEAKQWRLDEHQFSAALAVVNSVKPRNEMEAALAAQMVAIHLLTMKVSAYALKHEYDTRTAATAGKLAKAFTSQLEALQSLRGEKPQSHQTITVRKELHQHVHYHRGEDRSDGQPHEPPATIVDQRASLPSPQPGGEAMPLPGGEGEEAVPDARRVKSGCAQR
jgi:hypothetical protein